MNLALMKASMLLAQAAAEGEKDGSTDYQQMAIDFAKHWGPMVLKAVAIFIIGRWIAVILRGMLRRVLDGRKIDGTLTGFLCSITYMALMTMVVVAAIGAIGVQTASFVAIIGAAGLAVGFALQGSLGNFAAGVLIILFRPFKAGDFVEIAGVSGVILDVQVFATTLKTGDNKKIIVPNGSAMGGNIINYSAHDTRRVDMKFGCGYGDDIKQAKEILEKILADDERILADPAPVVAVAELGDSSVNFVVRPWVKNADYWNVLWDTHEQVKLRFDAAGVSIPFPQRDVHLHQAS